MSVAVEHSTRRPPAVDPERVARHETSRRRTLAPWFGLGALMVVSVLLGWQRLRTGYWIDEGLTVGIAASHPILSIPSELIKDGSPPLYYVLLGLWTRVFGTSEPATHALSLVFAVAAVPVAYHAGRRLFDTRAAWFAATFASISPFLGFFSGETRMYSLVALESMIVCVTFSSAFIDRRRNGTLWFALSLIALIYTHYWGLYAAAGAAAAVLVLALLSEDRRSFVRPAVIGFGVPALAFLPWLPVFVSQLRSTGAPWSFTPTLRNAITEVSALVRDERVLVVLVLAIGSGLAAMISEARWRPRWYASPDVSKTTALILIGGSPIVIGWVLSHLEPSWATRYLAVVVGPLILLVGIGLSRARGVGIVALAIAAVISIQPITRISPGVGITKSSKSNANAIADVVRPELPRGSLVLVAQPEAVPLFAHYLGDGLRYSDPRGLVSDPNIMDWRDAQESLSAASVPGALDESIRGLHPGDRLLFVSSAVPTKDTDTDWIKRFRDLGRQWQIFLAHQPCLTSVVTVAPPLPQSDDHSEFPFRATVLECR